MKFIYKKLFNNFDDTIIKSSDAIFKSLFDTSFTHSHLLERRYANLRLPRQCGKSQYLVGVVNQIADKISYPNLNIVFVDGVHKTPRQDVKYKLSNNVNFFFLKNERDLSDDNIARFRGTQIDIILFDEVEPDLAYKFLTHQYITPCYIGSENFVAFGLHTL